MHQIGVFFAKLSIMPFINKNVLMSSTDYFDDSYAINAHMDDKIPVDLVKAAQEHIAIADCLQKAGVNVQKVPAPAGCQDGVYTANWALIAGNKAIMANLPNVREAEEAYAEGILIGRGYQIIKLPKDIHFSGQGDCLPCGSYLFIGTNYRTSPEAHDLLQLHSGLTVVGLQTIPQKDANDNLVINSVTGWPDSFFYDLDLALAVISPTCIAWCPDAFVSDSQDKIRAITDIEKIEVSLDEAMNGFACNLVSTGQSVVMSDHAPHLKAQLEARGMTVFTPNVTELLKGGGFIRCTTLTLQFGPYCYAGNNNFVVIALKHPLWVAIILR